MPRPPHLTQSHSRCFGGGRGGSGCRGSHAGYGDGNRITSHCPVSIKHIVGDIVFLTALMQIPFLLGKKGCTRAPLGSLVQLYHNCVYRNCILQNCPGSVTWFILSCQAYHSALPSNSPGAHLWQLSYFFFRDFSLPFTFSPDCSFRYFSSSWYGPRNLRTIVPFHQACTWK